MTGSPLTGGRDRGQATVEFALVLPFACLLLTGFVQVAVVVRDQLAVQAAAREAARAASVAADGAGAAADAAQRAIELRPLDVSLTEAGGIVTATVSHVNHTEVPLIGALLPDVTLDASVSMAVEPP